MARFDFVVVGLGAFGSAAAYRLARRGHSVLGVDRFSPPHAFGSSWGDTRVTRVAIGEGVEYSPLAKRSNELWREIEADTGERLFDNCGCLFIPGTGSLHGVANFMDNIEASAVKFDVPHEVIADGRALRRRFPQFAVEDTDSAFLDKAGGYLFPESCIRAQLRLAAQHGARLLTNTVVKGFRTSAAGVTIEIENGETHEAGHLLLTAGAWLPALLGREFVQHFRVTRQVLFWFEIRSNVERFTDDCPAFIWDVTGRGDAKSDIYGFPLLGPAANGLKVTHEELGETTNPDNVRREVDPREAEYTYETYIKPFMPDLGPRVVRTETCLYTNVRNGRFVIDRHPDQDRVVFASPCSGHGFKHSAAVGEGLAAMLTDTRPEVDLSPFRLKELLSST